jgi:basic membrane protein A
MDEFNAAEVDAEMQAAVDATAAEIAAGTLTVHNYMDDETCPALTF